MPVEHSPKTGSSTIKDLPPDGMAPPNDGRRYTKDEIANLPSANHQWLHHHQELFDWETVHLMDYHEDFVGSSAKTLSDKMGDLTVTLQQLLTGKGPQQLGTANMEDVKPEIPVWNYSGEE
jgi:hypothetical protein